MGRVPTYPRLNMHRIKSPSRKRTISTKQDLIEAIKEYEYINYIVLSWKYDSDENWYIKNKDTSEFYYCQYCMRVKNYNDKNMPLLELIEVGRWSHKIYCKCVNCGIIVCYDCFNKVQVINKKYLKTTCKTCHNQKIQADKPTKRCECSDKCIVQIPITNLKGEPQKYANGHGLKLYHSTHNFKWIEDNERIENNEREQYIS